MSLTTVDILFYSIRGLFILLFLVFGWREAMLLLRRPAGNMGTGLSRIWSVGRTTLLEAWAGRVWLLPLLWLGLSGVLIFAVRPFDESERIPLYIRMLLTGQEMLLLVMLWVMACVSLPRERERKILVTNASKPLSRLEILVGKMVGFSVAAGLLLLVMGACSMVILTISNSRLREASRQAYELQMQDFANRGGKGANAGKAAEAPSAALKRLSEEGSLFAYNYITVPKGGMSIVGGMDLSKNPPVRFIKGGSSQTIKYTFGPNLQADDIAMLKPRGLRPFFVFEYNVMTTTAQPPDHVELRVTVVSTGLKGGAPPRYQGATLRLNSIGQQRWEPDNPEWFLSLRDSSTGELLNNAGEVTLDVSCTTPGVVLEVRDGANPDPVTGMLPAGANFNTFYVADPTKPRSGITPRAMPKVRGFERYSREEITGPESGVLAGSEGDASEMAVFRFTGKETSRIPNDKGHFTVALVLDRFMLEHPELPTFAQVRVFSLDQPGTEPYVQEVEVLEKRLVTVQVPVSYMGDPDPAKRGDMIVAVASATPGHSLSFIEEAVRIELPQASFAGNLLKSEWMIFLEAVLLIVISVTCSVRVGWPVAMLCSTVVVVFGYFVEFLRTLPEYGGLQALNYYIPSNASGTLQALDTVTLWLWRALGMLAAFVPDFTIYRPTDFIVKLQSMPMGVLGSVTLSTVAFTLPVVAIAYLLFRKQELG